MTRDRHWPPNFPQFIERRNAFTLAAGRIVTVLFSDLQCEQLTTGNFFSTQTRKRKIQKYVSYHTEAAGLAWLNVCLFIQPHVTTLVWTRENGVRTVWSKSVDVFAGLQQSCVGRGQQSCLQGSLKTNHSLSHKGIWSADLPSSSNHRPPV